MFRRRFRHSPRSSGFTEEIKYRPCSPLWHPVPCLAACPMRRRCIRCQPSYRWGTSAAARSPFAIVQEDQDLPIRRGPIRPGAAGNVEGHRGGLVQHVRRAIPVFVISPQRIHGFVPVGDRDMSQQLRGIKCACSPFHKLWVLLHGPADPPTAFPSMGL